MIKLSVVIITLNEEKNLPRCLGSVKDIADEIIVIDSNSIDKTLEIATKHGAITITQPFLGYVKQKQFADLNASYDWILSIDADEELSVELQESIKSFKKHPDKQAYQISRLNNYCGKWIKHCGWYPDRKIRLYKKGAGTWQGQKVHEKWELYDNTIKPGILSGDLYHYSFNTIAEHVQQIAAYSDLGAQKAVENNRNISLLKMVVVPRWNFIINYFFRLGILDGYYGFIICRLMAVETFIKYAKIRQYTKLKKEGKQF